MLRKCVIFDIDGTLANCEHRRHHLDRKDYDAFYGAMGDDLLIEPVAKLLEMVYYFSLIEAVEIFLCSGRPDDYRQLTEEWLDSFSIVYERLYMRPSGDFRSDVIVKREMLREIEKEYEILFIVDDRKRVVDMWREEGYVCLQTAPGFDETPKYTPGTLHLLVGPSGAGKSTYFTTEGEWHHSERVSSDDLRKAICGDFQDQSANEQVFAALHAMVKARIENGLDTVVDATNIRDRDRRAIRDLCPSNCNIVYHVVDRPLDEKLRDRGWRPEELVRKHHEVFKANLKAILAGDNDPRVMVIDRRGYV